MLYLLQYSAIDCKIIYQYLIFFPNGFLKKLNINFLNVIVCI